MKICGITDEAGIDAAAEAGARYIGLNFFPPSPRYAAPERAAVLAAHAPLGLAKVALLVDPDDAALDVVLDVVPIDMIQLHGHESPERVSEVRARYGLPVMKAIGLAGPEDLALLDAHEAVADQLLVDTKAPPGAPLPGGTGMPFDWSLLAGRKWRKPWMLAGGLKPETVAEAVRLTGARQVDVSSGVEVARGVKDADLIRAFVAAATA
ncbi:phosphoribosylanthranilate isomerase [Pseudoroseicyclus aestuarii]|uniref:N-(5'-phosphoribosyl)anthranilate isomerase n=1 Tax=Pseudoroseicyclus aestuarii TaxID=1795041 RepID=A0A318SW48_9RHOB|nr:phosphoribosylanthranilate isomerase [Pseudoroseicyclus aestuarii]